MDTQTQEQPAKRKRGRPKGTGKICPEIIAAICTGIENGLSYKGAASHAGVDTKTFYTWKNKATVENASAIYIYFLQQLEKAELKAKNRLELAIHKSAHGYEVVKKRQVIHPKTGEVIWLEDKQWVVDHQMQRFIAERRHSDDWGQKNKLDLTSGDQPIEALVFGAVTLGSNGEVTEGESEGQ